LPPLVPVSRPTRRSLYPAARLHRQKRDKMIVYFQRNCGNHTHDEASPRTARRKRRPHQG
jgi:hypothetical protein